MSGFAKQIDDDLREETRLQDPVTEKPESAPAPTAATAAWPVGDCPNGGTTAWLVVLGAWCTSFCSFGWVNSMTFPSVMITATNTGHSFHRHRYFPRVLPVGLSTKLLFGENILDPVFAGVLHVCNGKQPFVIN